MQLQEHKSQFASRIDSHLATLSKIFGAEGQQLLQSLIVNGNVAVHECWRSDQWNPEIAYHGLYLYVPEALYLAAVHNMDEISLRIAEKLNTNHNIPDEHIDKVLIIMDDGNLSIWREESGVMMRRPSTVPQTALDEIWLHDGYRVFFSHKSEAKVETLELKDKLSA